MKNHINSSAISSVVDQHEREKVCCLIFLYTFLFESNSFVFGVFFAVVFRLSSLNPYLQGTAAPRFVGRTGHGPQARHPKALFFVRKVFLINMTQHHYFFLDFEHANAIFESRSLRNISKFQSSWRILIIAGLNYIQKYKYIPIFFYLPYSRTLLNKVCLYTSRDVPHGRRPGFLAALRQAAPTAPDIVIYYHRCQMTRSHLWFFEFQLFVLFSFSINNTYIHNFPQRIMTRCFLPDFSLEMPTT